MRINCDNLREFVKEFSIIHQCDVIKNGMLRMATSFQYPNGSSIDLFLGERGGDFFNDFILTDLGQTTSYLLDLNIKTWTTKKRKQVLSDICQSLDVKQDEGELQIVIANDKFSDIPQAIIRLSQACIRLSDLVLTQRFKLATVFKDELEEFIENISLKYETSVIMPGQYGKDVSIDFQVSGRNIKSLIQTLSTANLAAAHSLGNEVFRKWYDISEHRLQYQFLTVYDTNNDVFRDDDIARLGSVSTVLGFPAHQEELNYAIAA